jgi:plasmid stabilization system protein ParE
MAYSIDFLPAAEIDLDNTTDWYTRFNKELANDFLNKVNIAIQTILSNPKQFQKIYKTYRKVNLARFPYKIIYKIEMQSIIIVAVSHHKRSQAHWKKRL